MRQPLLSDPIMIFPKRLHPMRLALAGAEFETLCSLAVLFE
jgi:hypothetical protein